MDSPTAFSRYIPQNSKKRVFVPGSSSSGCAEVEVLEVPPPAITRSSKPKPSKQKEVICHEIIDVDVEEDCDDDGLTDFEIDKSAKGKKTVSSSSFGVSSLANEESGNDILTSTNGAAGLNDSMNVDDFSSDLYYGEDEWIESYYDDIIYDDDSVLESHFDHMDIPPGVEAPFPWLPNDTKVSTASSSTYLCAQLQTFGASTSHGLNPSLKDTQIKDLSSPLSNPMTGTHLNVGNQHLRRKLPSEGMDSSSGQKRSSFSSSSTVNTTANLSSQSYSGSLTHKSAKEPWRSFVKIKKKHHLSHSMYANPYNQSSSGPVYPNSVSSVGQYHSMGIPPNTHGVGHSMPMWQDLPMGAWDSSLGSSGYMNGSSFPIWEQSFANEVNGASSKGTARPTGNVDEILQNFNNFKKFDTVEDFSDHHYSKNGSVKQPPKIWAKKIQEEWKILEVDLPDEIFVRVYESRMDLLRAVIIGAEGTPYHDGLFFFDVFFPSSYPNVPPHVYYHSGGLRINPNLYNCGKVCLSLLNTWTGSGKEKWIPGVSTILQVLVSLQGLILNAKPYFNEPGYERTSGTASGEKRSLEYNERTFIYSLRTMVYNMRRPPKHFEDFVYGYFCKHARDILISCKAYLEGAQVGCLVRGGVQDVDEGDKSCSQQFKSNLAGFITTLVNTFSEIGAKDCEEFLALANKAKANGPPNAYPLALDLFN